MNISRVTVNCFPFNVLVPLLAFGGNQHHCWMSCDHELANEWARCSWQNASYITIEVIGRVINIAGEWGQISKERGEEGSVNRAVTILSVSYREL